MKTMSTLMVLGMALVLMSGCASRMEEKTMMKDEMTTMEKPMDTMEAEKTMASDVGEKMIKSEPMSK